MNVLITGGSSGLGAAIVRKIAEAGHKVYFTFNSSVEAAELLVQQFPSCEPVRCDFKNEYDVNNLKDQIAMLDIDVLINNAYTGAVIKSHFYKIPATDFLKGFTDNVMPTIIITQAAISHFRKKKFGKIITILTSGLISTPPAGSAVYNANKAYLQQLAKIWAVENARHNIVSNSVSPALMRTALTEDVDERVLDQIIENHPLKALLTPAEVADAVLFLLNASQQINGMDIVLNAASNIK
ncbi:MAG: SDR family NAD(P)-dependent oxidoreductase [Flavipsychrobacter sp.]|nr:SDR family NAD(P)-dependent oxidoreductase [Flavipsychrobacter sp.]